MHALVVSYVTFVEPLYIFIVIVTVLSVVMVLVRKNYTVGQINLFNLAVYTMVVGAVTL
jgi:hypothetical protein